MVLPIYVYGSEVLRKVAEDVDINENPEQLKQLIADMIETMHSADGVGLAAPQVGVSKRLLVVDGKDLSDSFPELKDFHRVMINPVVLSESEQTCEYSEGCLSVPGIYADVTRPESIKVSYINGDFEQVEEEFSGFACRMVQHEMSHLDGDLFVDRVASIRKKMISKKLNNIANGRVSARYKTKLK